MLQLAVNEPRDVDPVLIGLLQRGHESPDPLRSEVRLRDHLRAELADRVPRRGRKLGRLRMPEQDQRLLIGSELAGVDQHLSRSREPLRGALPAKPTEPGAQRGRPRGPDQPMTVVERAQNPLHFPRPPLRGVGPVLGRAERVVGDE